MATDLFSISGDKSILNVPTGSIDLSLLLKRSYLLNAVALTFFFLW